MMALVKILMPIQQDSIYGGDSETVWAMPLGGDLFEIRNVPFFAKGISMRDVVRAQGVDGPLIFEKVEYHRGHSTYRIYTKDGRHSSLVKAVISELNTLGATVEPADE